MPDKINPENEKKAGDAFYTKWQDVPPIEIPQFGEIVKEKAQEQKPPTDEPKLAPEKKVKPPPPPSPSYLKEKIKPKIEKPSEKKFESDDIFVKEESDHYEKPYKVQKKQEKDKSEDMFKQKHRYVERDEEKKQSNTAVAVIMFIIMFLIMLFGIIFVTSKRRMRVKEHRYEKYEKNVQPDRGQPSDDYEVDER